MRGWRSSTTTIEEDEMSARIPPYRIVVARARDLGAIAAIELAAARLLAGHAPAAVLDEVTDMRELQAAQVEGRLWIALYADTPVGFAHVTLLEPGAAHLAEMDVHPEHGRRGLGRRLAEEVCRWAGRRGYPVVTLTTFRDVAWNMPFYARLGFAEVPRAQCTAAMKSILQDEGRRGLDPKRRVVMKFRTTLSEPT